MSGTERVALDELLEYADASAPSDHAAGIARLAYLVAVDELDDHLYEHAEYHLRLGLAHAPDNLSLRSHLGLALWGQGRGDEAVREFLAAIAYCRRAGKVAPMLWLLAARALDEIGRPGEAVALLEALTAFLPDDEGFWDLLAAVRARAVLSG